MKFVVIVPPQWSEVNSAFILRFTDGLSQFYWRGEKVNRFYFGDDMKQILVTEESAEYRFNRLKGRLNLENEFALLALFLLAHTQYDIDPYSVYDDALIITKMRTFSRLGISVTCRAIGRCSERAAWDRVINLKDLRSTIKIISQEDKDNVPSKSYFPDKPSFTLDLITEETAHISHKNPIPGELTELLIRANEQFGVNLEKELKSNPYNVHHRLWVALLKRYSADTIAQAIGRAADKISWMKLSSGLIEPISKDAWVSIKSVKVCLKELDSKITEPERPKPYKMPVNLGKE